MTTPYQPSPFKRDLTIPGDRSGRYQIIPHPLESGDFWIERRLRPEPPPRIGADVMPRDPELKRMFLEELRRRLQFQSGTSPYNDPQTRVAQT